MGSDRCDSDVIDIMVEVEKVKGFENWLLGVGAIVVVAIIMMGGGNTFSVTTVSGCSLQTQGQYLLVPQYGYFACEPIQGTVARNSVTWAKTNSGLFDSFWQSAVWCPQSGYGKECDVFIDGSYSNLVYFNSIPGSVVKWQKCGDTGCGAWIDKIVFGSGKSMLSTINKGEYIRVQANVANPNNQPLFVLEEEHAAYGLRQYERGMEPKTINDMGCSIPSSYNLCVDCIVSSLFDFGTNGVTNNPVRDLTFDQYSTYLKNWVVSPYALNVVRDIDGTDVDCSARKVYSFDTVTVRGSFGDSCYAFPATFKRDVTCCPGEIAGNQVCGDDFKWKVGDVGCLKNGVGSILYCDGQGGWVISGAKEVKKAVSCSSAGECVYTYKNVACTPPNNGCPSGSVCSTVNGLDNPVCVGGVTCTGADSNGDCYDDNCGQYITGCIVPTDCAKEGQDVGGLFGVGAKRCCEDLVVKDGKCQKEGGFDIGTLGIGIIVIGAIIGLYLLNKK